MRDDLSDGPSQGAASPGLDRMLADLRALEVLAESWDDAARIGAQAGAEAVDALNAEAFRRLIRALKAAPGFGPALTEAAQDEVVYAVLRRHGILRASLFERVEAALESVRPMLRSHGGDAEIVSIEPPRADIRFLGACDGCPASQLTFYAGVKKAVQDMVPEITEIRQAKGLGGGGDANTVYFASPFAAYQEGGWINALSLKELDEGETRFVDIENHALILSRFGGTVTCFANACAHMGMDMAMGEIEGGILTCPHHGFRYALDSGECLTAPEVQLHPQGVRVIGDRIQVRLVR